MVLKAFWGKGFRDAEAQLADMPCLRRELGPGRTPDHATLHRAEAKLLRQPRIRSPASGGCSTGRWRGTPSCWGGR